MCIVCNGIFTLIDNSLEGTTSFLPDHKCSCLEDNNML